MKDWISFFEKYKNNRKLLNCYRSELEMLPDDSPLRLSISNSVAELEIALRTAEQMLECYDIAPKTPRDALHRSEERLFLTHHYIRGLTMEATAEEMHISRDTLYRIRRRILSRGEVPDIPRPASHSTGHP